MGKLDIDDQIEKKVQNLILVHFSCIKSLQRSFGNNMAIYSTTLGLIFLLPLAISSPISGGSSGTCKLHTSHVDNLFARKHVGTNYAGLSMAENAMHHSCERNRLLANKETGVNGVLFGEVSAGFDPASGNHCSKKFTELYQCTGVPTGYTTSQKENFSECKSWWTKGQGCKSCKKTYTDAQRFYVEVDQNTGHFEYTKVQYEDSKGNWHTFNTNTCTKW